MSKANVREIFLSIQGEGPYVGERQLFIRFCGCNLKCKYCDTDFDIEKSEQYSPEELINKINSFGNDMVLSLTGGEPLLSIEFLKDFLPLAKLNRHKIYLETNGTLPNQLERIINLVDIVSADIKLPSSTGLDVDFSAVDKFLNISKRKKTFVKVVFNSEITEEEIEKVIELVSKYNVELILQPQMKAESFAVTTEYCELVFDKFVSKYKKVRLIPQMHKFLNVR